MKRLPLSVVLFLLLFSCKKENNSYTARIAIVNALPESAGIKVFAGDNILADSAVYGAFDAYKTFGSGTFSFGWQLKQLADPDSLFTTDIQPGSDLTLILYDTLSIYKGIFIRDVIQKTSSETKAYLRFFPLILGGDTIRVTNDTLKVLLGPRYLGDFEQSVPLSNFNLVDTFNTKLRLYNNSVLVDSLPASVLLPGKSYSLFAIGKIGEVGTKRPRLVLKEQ